MEIEDIREAVRSGRFDATDHADERSATEQITDEEISASVLNGEIIEDYPDDRPHPSCLIYGRTQAADVLHSVWAYNANEGLAILITVYRPDPGRWIDWRIRRPKSDGAG